MARIVAQQGKTLVVLEELRLIAGVKFAALQGNLAMLSKME
jgi:hypothetical protein